MSEICWSDYTLIYMFISIYFFASAQVLYRVSSFFISMASLITLLDLCPKVDMTSALWKSIVWDVSLTGCTRDDVGFLFSRRFHDYLSLHWSVSWNDCCKLYRKLDIGFCSLLGFPGFSSFWRLVRGCWLLGDHEYILFTQCFFYLLLVPFT